MQTQTTQAAPMRRTVIVCVIALVLFALIVGQLLNLQVRGGEEHLLSAEQRKTKELSLKGARGSITDKNGLPLAYDTPSYDLEFSRDTGSGAPTEEQYSQAIRTIVAIVEQNGGQTIDLFSIVRDEYGVYSFDWRTENEEVAKKRRGTWFSNFYMPQQADGVDVTAEQAYQALLAKYGLEDLPWEEARRVLAIWEEWQNKAFLSKPVRIARGLDIQTVAQIEARQMDLPGLSVVESTTRIYPRGETAAHIVGYMGAINENYYEQYVEGMGYAPDDLLGVSGIEQSMEEQLTGNILHRQGRRYVEVNNYNRVMRELSYEPASDGNNVVLTIDLPLQILTEQALERTIQSARMEQLARMAEATDEKKAQYQNAMISRGTDSLNLAASGAAVVMEVKTGKVLALVNYPSFNPNDFVGGLSQANFQKYFDVENSELAKLSPMYNRAVQTRATPGSTFKMATGLAGVMEGVVEVDTAIDDRAEGYDVHIKSGKVPRCWVWPNTHLHQGMTLETAVVNSCNYYFYSVADWLGVERLHAWATRLGLTSRTGIEFVNETTSIVGNQQVLYDVTRTPSRQSVARTKQAVNTVREVLRGLREDLRRDYDDERIERVLTELMSLVVQDGDLGVGVRTILMGELGLTNAEVSGVIGVIQRQLTDLRWNYNETILTGIGQSITEITPIAMARYISAIANGGTVYEAQIVDRILAPDGSVVTEKEPVVVTRLEGVEEPLRAIKDGMHGVIDEEEGGTAAKYFEDYPYTNQIAMKTGTAQVNLIDVEDNAWFVGFAPFDDPEIAVVVFIGNGMSAGYCSPTVQEVFTYYFEGKTRSYEDPQTTPGEWTR